MSISISKKAIVTGKIIEIYEYERPIFKGSNNRRRGRVGCGFTSQEEKQNNRNKTVARAKAYVRRIINANPDLDKFLTLTYKENLQNIETARKDFDKFIKRLKSKVKRLKYVNVIEFQKRGAIHFHLVCNLPYIDVKKLSKIWRLGFVKINKIDNVDNIGAYITKYMTKDNADSRLIGKKCYTMSKNLKKPTVYVEETEINALLEDIESVKHVYTNSYYSDYYGNVTCTQIVCNTSIKTPTAFERFARTLGIYFTPLPDKATSPF